LEPRIVITESIEHEDTEPLIVGQLSHSDKSGMDFGDVIEGMTERGIGIESDAEGFFYGFDL
jgi:hypothetical protein